MTEPNYNDLSLLYTWRSRLADAKNDAENWGEIIGTGSVLKGYDRSNSTVLMHEYHHNRVALIQCLVDDLEAITGGLEEYDNYRNVELPIRQEHLTFQEWSARKRRETNKLVYEKLKTTRSTAVTDEIKVTKFKCTKCMHEAKGVKRFTYMPSELGMRNTRYGLRCVDKTNCNQFEVRADRLKVGDFYRRSKITRVGFDNNMYYFETNRDGLQYRWAHSMIAVDRSAGVNIG